MSDIVLIDKPTGITSFDVIRRLRRQLNIKKMGHAGTLDPMASGLMIIGVGEGTKKLTDYIKLDKEYVAEILVGVKTESGDLEGVVLEERLITDEEVEEIFSGEKISSTLKSMIGVLTLPVSAYSAIKREGVPLYKKAREALLRGQSIPDSDLPIREMKVYEAELLDPETLPMLRRATMVVELHEFARPGVTDLLHRRFAATHRIDILDQDQPLPVASPDLAALPESLVRAIVSERRPTLMCWMVLVPIQG